MLSPLFFLPKYLIAGARASTRALGGPLDPGTRLIIFFIALSTPFSPALRTSEVTLVDEVALVDFDISIPYFCMINNTGYLKTQTKSIFQKIFSRKIFTSVNYMQAKVQGQGRVGGTRATLEKGGRGGSKRESRVGHSRGFGF